MSADDRKQILEGLHDKANAEEFLARRKRLHTIETRLEEMRGVLLNSHFYEGFNTELKMLTLERQVILDQYPDSLFPFLAKGKMPKATA